MNDLLPEDLEILEDEIISIERYDTMDTIDIEIESKNKLFFANDILTHNSGFDNSDLTLGSIAESAALLHTVDALFGIITSPEMKARKEYFLKYMADRVSGLENTKKRFEIEPKYARISEDKTSGIIDMDMMMKNIGDKYGKNMSIPPPNQDLIKEINPTIHDGNITGSSLFR